MELLHSLRYYEVEGELLKSLSDLFLNLVGLLDKLLAFLYLLRLFLHLLIDLLPDMFEALFMFFGHSPLFVEHFEQFFLATIFDQSVNVLFFSSLVLRFARYVLVFTWNGVFSFEFFVDVFQIMLDFVSPLFQPRFRNWILLAFLRKFSIFNHLDQSLHLDSFLQEVVGLQLADIERRQVKL